MSKSFRYRVHRALAVLLLAVAATAATSCADVRGRLYVQLGPPVALVEMRHAPPGPAYVWIEGYQHWDGRAYVWIGGRWELPPRPRAIWIPGRWVHDRHGWYYLEGRWR